MGDLISRQAAIKAADSIIERDTSGNNDVVKAMTAWQEYIKALPSAQPVNIASDCISRATAVDAIDEIESEVEDGYGFQYAKWREFFCNLPPTQPELITKIQNGIKATDADDVYSCGMRNGMRWCISLIDGKEPLYENCPPAQPGWIPVTERLPDRTDTYLVQVGINENGEGMHTEVRTAEWNVIWQTWYVHTTHCFVGDIIKWMPIPREGGQDGTV